MKYKSSPFKLGQTYNLDIVITRWGQKVVIWQSGVNERFGVEHIFFHLMLQ